MSTDRTLMNLLGWMLLSWTAERRLNDKMGNGAPIGGTNSTEDS